MNNGGSESTARILIVEAEVAIGLELRGRVEALGYGVCRVAASGGSALDLAAAERPDLILMDVIPAMGMDGIDTAEAIWDRLGIPIVFIAAQADQERLKRAKPAGPFGYLPKPFQDRDLRVAIDMALYAARVCGEREQVVQDLLVHRQIVNSSADGMTFVGPDYVYKLINDAALLRLGLERDRVLGRTVPEIVGAAVFEKVIKARLDRCLAGETVFYADWFAYPVGRKYLDVTYAPCRDSASTIIGAAAVMRDITDRRLAEEALQASEDKFRTAFMISPDSVNINRLEDGMFVDINDGFTKLRGYTREEVIGKTSLEISVWCDPTDRSKLVEGLREKGYYENLEAKFLRKNGKVAIGLMSARVIMLDGAPHILSITRDITERKHLEDQLRQALKMDAVGTLAGGIAHDFNNLTQAIIGYTQLLLMGRNENDPDYHELSAVCRAGERAAQLVRQLLTFSRRVEGERQIVSLNRIISETAKILKRTIPRMIEIDPRLAGDLWTIDADPIQMEQILLNLGSNAADAMPEGGRLTMTTENRSLGEECRGIDPDWAPGDYVLLTVADTGHGMDPATMEKIFDPFFTTKEKGKGTGLGLASVYGIVKGHGGMVVCESAPEQGAVFRIYLPAAHRAEAGAGRSEEEEPKGGSETILVIDDEVAIRELMVRLLEHFGYQVVCADSGEAGLEIYRNRSDEIALVVLDLNMPGMGGRRCLTEMLKMFPNARIAITSGHSAAEQIQESMSSGAAGFIAKPYNIRSLLLKVREILDRPREKD